MEAVFLKLLDMSITASWLVLAVVILRLVLKKAPKAIICVLWALVALRLIVPVSVESPLSLVPDLEPVQTQNASDLRLIPNAGFLIDAVPESVSAAVESPSGSVPTSPWPVLSRIWLAGMVAMALYVLISWLLVLRKTREAVELEKGVWCCDRVNSPFILGIVRPRIILPSALEPGDMPYVLAHERAHLKRLDHLWKPVGFLLLTVHWFNPVLWLAYILLCRDIEFACDEKVLSQLGTEQKQAYSTALINCSVPRYMISACPLAFGEVGVKKRIQSILSYKKPTFWIIIIALIVSVAVAVCFLTDPEKTRAEEAVHIEIVNQQADALTVEWTNNTQKHIIIGSGDLYRKTEDQWKEPAEAVSGNMLSRGWSRSVLPGQTWQQILYYCDIGITEPGQYRLNMKYTDGTGAEKTISLEFEIDVIEQNSLAYDGAVWSVKLICEDSPDLLKPTVLLTGNGLFQFQFSGYSSYVPRGTYEQSSEGLVLLADDGEHVYRFKSDGWMQYRFDAQNSSALPRYKYDGVLQAPVADGGLFEAVALDGKVITAASVPAYVDSDDIGEYWTVTYQPGHGLYVFELTATAPGGEIMYSDCFQYEFQSLMLNIDPDGQLQLLVTKPENGAGGENLSTTVSFEVSVRSGHIVLSGAGETLQHLDT